MTHPLSPFLAFELPETREVMGVKTEFTLQSVGLSITLGITDGDRRTILHNTLALDEAFMLRDFLNRHLTS